MGFSHLQDPQLNDHPGGQDGAGLAEVPPTGLRGRLSPAVLRAGAIAAAMSLAISGGAYAAVEAAGDNVTPLSESQIRLDAIGAPSAAGGQDDAAGADAAPGAVQAPVQTEITEVQDSVETHGSLEQETDDLPTGQTRVETEGVDGLTRTTYRVTVVDGQEVSREAIATVVVTAKVDEVVLVGTGEASSSASPSTSAGASETTTPTTSTAVDDGSVWAQLAQCESGGNPATNTGNGYYGMYQFTLSTWQSLGGTGYPHEADAATQTAMAQKLQARSGWGQWPHCAAKLGLL